MTKELQNLVWSILPKEFKEEVKKLYADALDASNSPHEPDDRKWGNYRVALLEKLFGIHNLTSDAEGEDEMLCVSRKKIQEVYRQNKEEINRENVSSSDKDCYEYANEVLKTLFGSKCLPDEMQNLSNLDKIGKDCNVDSLSQDSPENCDNANRISDGNNNSHKSPDTCKCPNNVQKNNTDLGHLSKSSSNFDRQFDTILKDSFREHNRLHIAAMAMQGILSNADRLKKYEHIATEPPCEDLTKIVARNALRYADALIKEELKGGESC